MMTLCVLFDRGWEQSDVTLMPLRVTCHRGLFDRGWEQSDVTLMPLRVTCHRGWGQNDGTPMLIPMCVTRDRV